MLIPFGFGFCLTVYYRAPVMGWLFAPARGALSPTGQPIFTGVAEIFQFVIQMGLWGGVVFATPVAMFHVFRLISPLLGKKLRRFLVIFMPAALVCYITGAAFAYFVLLPASFLFLLGFGAGAAVAYIRVSEYFDLALAMVGWMGVVFELPLAMFLAVKMRIVRHERLKRLRRYAYVAALFFGALITPGSDPVNQMLITVPIIVLFEAGLLLAFLARSRSGARGQARPNARFLPDGDV